MGSTAHHRTADHRTADHRTTDHRTADHGTTDNRAAFNAGWAHDMRADPWICIFVWAEGLA